MIGKIPSIKMLRTKLQESESKLGSKGSDSDKDFLGVVKREIEELDKELSGKRNNKDCEVDDLRLSSESDEIKHGSLEVSLSSEFSISEDFGRACWSSQSKLKAAKPPVQFKKPEKNAILVSENKELLR